MLSLRIAAIGRERGTPMAGLTETYLSRAAALAAAQGLNGPQLIAADAPKALSGPQRQKKEAEILAGLCADGGDAVILDEAGKDISSAELARLIGDRRDAGVPALSFLIGGADGHDSAISTFVAPRPIRKIAFGRATWPHQLVRVMLAEQLYRAISILAGHPYHRA